MKFNNDAFVIKDALLVTQNARRQIIKGDVRVEAGRIVHVGPNANKKGANVIYGTGYAIIPGFVNLHTHVAMSLLRGIADDVNLSEFLKILFAVDSRRKASDVEAGAAAGIAEMLLSGTTAFLDMYYHEDSVAKAAKELGSRGFLGWAVLDPDMTTQKGVPLKNAEKFIKQWRNDELVTPLVAPQGVYVCSKDTWLDAKDLASKYKTYCHFHLSETEGEVREHIRKTGSRPAEWLDAIGFLGPRMVAAHAVWLSKKEISILGSRKIGIAHCATSNMKLASGGVCPVSQLMASGSNIGLGTDSVASNNSLSMLREMHMASLLQKHSSRNASILTAQQILDFATIGGARALGIDDEIGSLEKGKKADFSLVRLDHHSMMPARPSSIVSHIVNSASEEAIDSVYVNGRKVVDNRKLASASWNEIRKKAQIASERLWDR